jgi:hypothetical protein
VQARRIHLCVRAARRQCNGDAQQQPHNVHRRAAAAPRRPVLYGRGSRSTLHEPGTSAQSY